MAELGALDGELVAVAALRPGDAWTSRRAAARPGGGARAGRGRGRRAALEEDEPADRAGPAQGTLDFDCATGGPLTVAAYAGDEVLVAEAETLAAFALARGERPVVAHDWKTLAMADEPCAAPPLEHDTMVAAYLIDPARRGYPLDELAADAGLGVDVTRRRRSGRARRAHPRSWPSASAQRLEEDGLDPAAATRSSCRWWTCWWRWSAPA